jgi:hypothetical protein
LGRRELGKKRDLYTLLGRREIFTSSWEEESLGRKRELSGLYP